MNLPNQLTISRFWLTAIFLWAVFARSALNDTLALVLFCLAALTDLFDGIIARRRGLVTNFGMLMDPLADKVLICSAFIALVERSQLNPVSPVTVQAWMAVLIVARELAITGLRLLAASKSVVLAAERFGKCKTIAQITAVIALLVLDAYVEWWPWLQDVFRPWVSPFARVALWAALLLTVTSGAQYLWRNREMFLRDL
jgi:CDP-diacylglycerol--glycerol-3-phosphate 3-phosphatidyltransferase